MLLYRERVPHVGHELLTLSGTDDFTPFWGVHDFTHSLYIHMYVYYRMCQYKDYVYGLITGLLDCINLTAWSPTYFLLS